MFARSELIFAADEAAKKRVVVGEFFKGGNLWKNARKRGTAVDFLLSYCRPLTTFQPQVKKSHGLG